MKTGRSMISRIIFTLCIISITSSLLSLKPRSRGAIQDLTAQIIAGTVPEALARERALALKIPAHETSDFVVQDLVKAAEAHGITNILNPSVKLTPQIAVTNPSLQVPSSAIPSSPASNPAVTQLYNEYIRLSTSLDTFKPGNSFTYNIRHRGWIDTEYNRLTEQALSLSTAPLNQKDNDILENLRETVVPTLLQKIQKIDVELATTLNKFLPPLDKSPGIVSDTIRQLAEEYINKDYTVAQLMQLRTKNMHREMVNEYANKNKAEIMTSLESSTMQWIKDSAFQWDIKKMREAFYQLSLAKIRLKELDPKDFSTRSKLSQAQVQLLTKNGDTSQLVFDFTSNPAAVKNNYFVKFIDEFEKEQAAPRTIMPVSAPRTHDTILKSDKHTASTGGDDRNYLKKETKTKKESYEKNIYT